MKALCLAFLSGIIGISSVWAKLYDFNTPEQWNDFYNPSSSLWGNTQTGGISNSPWVETTSVGNNTVPYFKVLKNSFDTTDLDSFTVGVSFLWESHPDYGVVTSGANAQLTIGIGRSSDEGKDFEPRFSGSGFGAETADMIALGIQVRSGSPNVVVPRSGLIVSSSNITYNQDNNKEVTLTQGEWYELEAVFEKGFIENSFDITLNLYSLTSDGERVGEALFSYEINRINMNLTGNDVHAFFGNVSRRFDNIAGIDNFYVQIPENSSIGLGVLGLFLLGYIKRRRVTR